MGARPICCVASKTYKGNKGPFVQEDSQAPAQLLQQTFNPQQQQPVNKTQEGNWFSQGSQFGGHSNSQHPDDIQKSLETREKLRARVLSTNNNQMTNEEQKVLGSKESALPSIQSYRKIEKIQEIMDVVPDENEISLSRNNLSRKNLKQSDKDQNSYRMSKEDIDKSIQQWMVGGAGGPVSNKENMSYNRALQGSSGGAVAPSGLNRTNLVTVVDTVQKKVKEASMYCGDSMSRMNGTFKSSAMPSMIIGRTSRSQLQKSNKQKIKGKSKLSPVNKVPQSSYFGNNSQKSLNMMAFNNKTINKNHGSQSKSKNDSKSIDFQITYIERKQESFFKKGNMTNATQFLKSNNVTADINKQNQNQYTQFINQKSIIDEERAIISHLVGNKDKIRNNQRMGGINRVPDTSSISNQQSQDHFQAKQSGLPNIINNNNGSSNYIGKQNEMINSPHFNQDRSDDAMTTKQGQQIQQRQYPVINNFEDEEASHNVGDEHQHQQQQYLLDQIDVEEPHDEEDEGDATFKEEISPNEACYFEIEPIEPNTMISLNDAQAKAAALSYKQQSKIINGMTFDIWDPSVHEKMKFYTEKAGFIDEAMRQGHQKQEVQGKQWKRISEISMNPGLIKQKLQPSKVFAGDISNEANIAAITAVISHDIKFSTDFIGQSLYPQNNGKAIMNNYGKYGVKLCVNGEQRIVEIDDYVLFNTKKKTLSMSYYESDQSEFALSLLEKAYSKVYKGMDTQHCVNPSIDIHMLTNWIPETVNFDDVSNKSNLWARLLQNFRDQNIIICLQSQVDEAGDASFYSVLDLIEVDDIKVLQCKSANKGSRKLYKFINGADKLPPLLKREQLLAFETGIFYVVWTEDIGVYFSSISLCWNTKIYPFSQRVHSKLNTKLDMNSHFYNDNFCLYNNPQVLFTIPPHTEDFEVRIMLRRHVKNFAERNTISFKLFTFDGHRIAYPLEPLRNFNYPTREICSDVFIFENSQEYESYALVLLDEDDNPEQQYQFFTLDVFSFIVLDLKELPLPTIDKSYNLQGKWRCEENDMLVGGSLLSHKFVYNPQYKIQVYEKTHIQIQVETDQLNSVQLMLYESGKDATEAPFSSILSNKNQGFFFNGYGFMEIILEPKDYTLVICPETNKQKGQYKIMVNKIVSPKYDYNLDLNMELLQVKSYPYNKSIDGKWTFQNSKGTNRILTDEFQAFMKNPGYVIKVNEATIMRCQLVPTDPVIEGHEIASVSICIFEILDQNKFRIVLEDDHYAGKAWGYFTEEFQLLPNKNGYLFLCINFDRGIEGNYQFNLMSQNNLSNDIKQLTDVFYKANTKTANGTWTVDENTSGGCSQEPTFFKNPQYYISGIKSPQQALFQIESIDQYPVGMVLFEISKSTYPNQICSLSCIDSAQLQSNPTSNSTFLIEVNNLSVVLKPNKDYVLVVSTYKPGMQGQYTLTTSMDNDFTQTLLKEDVLAVKQIQKGKFDALSRIEEDPLDQIQRLPHFMFTVSNSNKVRLQLHSNEDIGLRLFLFEFDKQNGLVIKQKSEDFSCFRFGALLTLSELDPQSPGYIIACQPAEVGFSGEYMLEIESQKPFSSFFKDFLLSDQNGNQQINKQQSSQNMESMQSEKGGPKAKRVIKKTSIIRRPE